MAGIAVEGSKRPGPRRPQQGLGRRRPRRNQPAGAFSGRRPGMKPGKAALLSDWAIDVSCSRRLSNCPDSALSCHTCAPSWVFKGLWGRGW